VLALLNRLFAVVVDVVDAHDGWINKFLGDAALAVFGAPEPLDDHAGAALASARALAEALTLAVPELDFGIGVATGTVVAGHLGDERRYEYTLIGDMVNVAARLTDRAKRQPHRITADAESIGCAGTAEQAHWRSATVEHLRGRVEPVAVSVPIAGVDRPVSDPTDGRTTGDR
jgi:adenylate cyclase